MIERPDLRVVDAGVQSGPGEASSLLHAGWREIGLGLARDVRDADIEWRLGDWGARAGDAGATLAEAAGIAGESLANLKKFVATAKGYAEVRRRTGVAFHLHYEAVALPEDTQDRLLDRAAAECWTRAEMREAALEARRSGKARRRPDPDAARDAAGRMRDRLDAEQRVAAGAAKRMMKVAVEASRSSEIRALHRSAQYGLARDIRREFGKAGAALRARHADAAAALAPIEGPEAGGAGADERAVAVLMDEIDPVLRAVRGRIAQASRDAAGMPPAERRALAARLEAAIDARIEGAQTVLRDAIQPALEHLAGEP